jgi:hypothetical protein
MVVKIVMVITSVTFCFGCRDPRTGDGLIMNCDEMPVTIVALAITKARTRQYKIFLIAEMPYRFS